MTPEALCEMQLAEETRRLTLKGRAAACLQVAAPALLAYRPGLCRRRAVGTVGLARTSQRRCGREKVAEHDQCGWF